MTINIQQMIYEELQRAALGYPVYTCPCDKMQIPYILIGSITTSTLPYSQELHKYEEIDITITIYDKPYSNRRCLEVLNKLKAIFNNLLENLNNIFNLSIITETNHNPQSFSTDLKLSFYSIR